MIELTIYGRGGRGGVTLAKLIATAYFLRGKHVQAFGVYGAERSGAPIQAFMRADDAEIDNHNQIESPDHIIVLDSTLIAPRVLTGLKPEGWAILNTPQPPQDYAELFAGRRVATIDANAIAIKNKLGSKAVPIVNTILLGAVAKVFDMPFADVEATLAEMKFGGPNLAGAREAYDTVQIATLKGKVQATTGGGGGGAVASILDADVGGMPVIRTGSWASFQPDRHQLTPPCNDGCPAGNDVRGFVQAVVKKDYDAALQTILQTSPLPGICGRVCPAPCMEACNRRLHDEAVNVREIERYVADHALWPEPANPTRQERIAVVGSGPAGLSAAYHLARLGYRVKLFEAAAELGGVLRTGIPPYRLPRNVLDREISFILRHGVEVETNCTIDRKALLKLTHEFAAVFIGTGLQELRALNLGNLADDMVLQGIDFLDRARRGEFPLSGQRVVVVGGGNTAMDAARTALRVGAQNVRIIYRRTRAEMPAIEEEIEEAIEEKIQLDELVNPLRLEKGSNGPVLTCQRMKLGEPDESGRRRPLPLESEDAIFDVECDKVLLALGQSSDLSILPEGSDVHEGEALLGLTGAPVFSGGDFATNEGTVTAAIGSGHRAALHVHKTLTGEDLFPPAAPPVAGADEIHMHVFTHVPREQATVLPPNVRRRSFSEVRLGLVDEPGHEAAVAEAERCFSCGVCNECDRCLTYCPEGVMLHEGMDRYTFNFDYCKGCGICASQCPRGVIYLREL
ncbi:MAG: 2-oxoacid:acceptor oxidoreductase family protein [Phycisphaerae bacterium]|jgi:2-oxoacid:acceptor oxidoreductase gamma subunit (pyruvate/2-ketoisovalerate family)